MKMMNEAEIKPQIKYKMVLLVWNAVVIREWLKTIQIPQVIWVEIIRKTEAPRKMFLVSAEDVHARHASCYTLWLF